MFYHDSDIHGIMNIFGKTDKLFPVKRVFGRIIGDIGEIAINFAKRCSDGENDEHYIELGEQI